MKVVSLPILALLILATGFNTLLFSQQSDAVLHKLTEDAEIILIGNVTSQNSNWNENKTRIYTKATIQVDEFLKGNNGKNSVEVIYPGGEVGAVGELYTHMPRFSNDEEVLLFLKKGAVKESFNVIYGEEGKLSIIEDPYTGEKVTTSNTKISSIKTNIKNFLRD